MAFDGQNVVLFGGFGSQGWLNDTWVWDGINWTRKPAFTAPSPRVGHGMTFDGQELILFGDASDTWLWNGSQWSQVFPEPSPIPGGKGGLVWDAVRQNAVFYDGSGTWVFFR